MTLSLPSVYSLSSVWSVLELFLIPIGGGIPGGVLLARDHGFIWPVTALLYLISDVILACLFEPILLFLISISKRSEKLSRVGEAFKKNMQKTSDQFGTTGGVFTLVMIAFGFDPMTGRSAAVAAGHGFVMGWMIAIMGDMLYFSVLMISTLWLDGILGNGTWTTIVMLIIMMGIPWAVRKIRKRKERKVSEHF